MYKRALLREEVKNEMDVSAMYHQIIESNGSKWKDAELMLYTIVELVGGTCHSIILNNDPVDLEHYRPYLYDCIRKIVSVFRA